MYRGVTHIGVGKAVEDADKHWDDDKAHKENEAGQHEQVAVDIPPALQRTAHVGWFAFVPPPFFVLLLSTPLLSLNLIETPFPAVHGKGRTNPQPFRY